MKAQGTIRRTNSGAYVAILGGTQSEGATARDAVRGLVAAIGVCAVAIIGRRGFALVLR